MRPFTFLSHCSFSSGSKDYILPYMSYRTDLRNRQHIIYENMLLLSHFSHVWFFITLWTLVTLQVPVTMGFSRQEYWSGMPCPPPGDLSNPGTEPMSPVVLALQTNSLPLSHQESPCKNIKKLIKKYLQYNKLSMCKPVLNHSVPSDALWPVDCSLPGSLPWDFLGKNTGVGCHFLLQGILLTRDGIYISCVSCIGRQILYTVPPGRLYNKLQGILKTWHTPH